MWPFRKAEKRNYTDNIVNSAIAAAANISTVGNNSAIISCANTVHRAFLGANVSGTTANVADIARRLVVYGEYVGVVRLIDEQPVVLPCSEWEVMGDGPHPSQWRYRVSIPAPSTTASVELPATGVVHVMLQHNAREPWRGLSMLHLAKATMDLLCKSESSLTQEASSLVGSIIPVPGDGSDESVEAILANINSLKGGVVLLQSTQEWGEGGRPPRDDYKAQRLGPQPTEHTVELWKQAEQSVLRAFGFSESVIEGNREAVACFYRLLVKPIALIITKELTRKLERSVSIDFPDLKLFDLQMRARAAMQLGKVNLFDLDYKQTADL